MDKVRTVSLVPEIKSKTLVHLLFSSLRTFPPMITEYKSLVSTLSVSYPLTLPYMKTRILQQVPPRNLTVIN